MAITISDEQITRTGKSGKELIIELACRVYEKNIEFTLGLAAEFAGISQREMMKELASRKISFHYDIDDLNEDLRNLKYIVNDSGK